MRRFRIDTDRLVGVARQVGEQIPERSQFLQWERPKPQDMRDTIREVARPDIDVPQPERERRQAERPQSPDVHGRIEQLIESADRSEQQWRERLLGERRSKGNANWRAP